jgi:hypothetical protein
MVCLFIVVKTHLIAGRKALGARPLVIVNHGIMRSVENKGRFLIVQETTLSECGHWKTPDL